MEVVDKVKNALQSVSLEPVFFLFCVNLGLVMIPNADLYLVKACRVNLNYSSEVCADRSGYFNIDYNGTFLSKGVKANMTEEELSDVLEDANILEEELTTVQEEVQELVSEIQAYNGLLQSAPAVVFTIFAGPLSDTYGRKPLMIMAIFGYLVLDVVFLINAFWFEELRVEYLLFECLQDFTGGAICFYLASYSYMVDTVHPSTRTWRMSILDSFMPIGFMMGLPLGTFLNNTFGPTVLYLTGVATISLAILYIFFFVKDHKALREAKKEEAGTVLSKFPGFNLGVFSWIVEIVMSGVKTILKPRADNGRTWVICFIMVFCFSKGIDSGSGTVSYMFYRLQYKITNTDMSTMMSVGGPLMLTSQLLLIPLLSGVLKLRDTFILSLAVAGVIVSDLIRAFNDELLVLYIAMVFSMLANTITTTSRSNLSKLMEEQEIGRAFSILGILQALIPVVSKPCFAVLYKHTIKVFPAAYLLVVAGLYVGVLALLIVTHIGLRRRDRRARGEEQLPESEHLKRSQI